MLDIDREYLDLVDKFLQVGKKLKSCLGALRNSIRKTYKVSMNLFFHE